MKKYLALCLLLAGCSDVLFPNRLPEPQPDQCLRRTIFKECLAMLPKGPQTTGSSSDWDEVVSACESAALYQSKRQVAQIKLECRAW